MHGAFKVVGRKRKQGRRTASGNLARGPAPNYKAMAAMQPHRRWLPERLRDHEKATTLLGILSLIHQPATEFGAEKGITEQQAEAGRRYAVAVGRYQATIGGPSGTVGAGKGYDCNPELCNHPDSDQRSPECECFTRLRRYQELDEALRQAGHKAQKAVNALVIHDRLVDIRLVRRGLDVLAAHLGLTAGRK